MMPEWYKAIEAISWGYKFQVEPSYDNTFIVVENPSFEEDDGSNPFLVIDMRELKEKAKVSNLQ